MTSESESSNQINARINDLDGNDCWIAGMEHLNKKPTPVTEYKLINFVSTFGAPPSVCLTLWNLTETARTGMRRSTRHIHLLMALFLMKNYPRSRAGAGAFGIHTDTWSYYTSNFVQAISALSVTMVRGLIFIASHENFLQDNWRLFHAVFCLVIFILDLLGG